SAVSLRLPSDRVCDVKRLNEPALGQLLYEPYRLLDGILLVPIDLLHRLGVLLSCHAFLLWSAASLARLPRDSDYSVTVTPIDRAVPSMIFIAALTSLAFRSGIFCSAISRTFERLIVPTLVRLGSPDPLSSPAFCLMRTAAGGVFVMNLNERSS